MSKGKAGDARQLESSGAQEGAQEKAREEGLFARGAAMSLGNTMAEWVVDPRQYVRAAVERACALRFPDEEAERAVAIMIAALPARVQELIQNFKIDQLHHALAQFATDCGRACFPKQPPTLEEQLRARAPRFKEKRWSPEEVGQIHFLAKPGDLIGLILAASIEIGGVKVERRKIRESLRTVWEVEQGLGNKPILRLEEVEKLAVYEEANPPRKHEDDPDRYKPTFAPE